MQNRRRWTPQEDLQLKREVEVGVPFEIIAKIHDRTVEAVKSEARMLRFKRKVTTL